MFKRFTYCGWNYTWHLSFVNKHLKRTSIQNVYTRYHCGKRTEAEHGILPTPSDSFQPAEGLKSDDLPDVASRIYPQHCYHGNSGMVWRNCDAFGTNLASQSHLLSMRLSFSSKQRPLGLAVVTRDTPLPLQARCQCSLDFVLAAK